MDLGNESRLKRYRSLSSSSSQSNQSENSNHSASSDDLSTNSIPKSKLFKSSTGTRTHLLECHLPPTCFPLGRTFNTKRESENHQINFHTFICRTPVKDNRRWRNENGEDRLWYQRKDTINLTNPSSGKQKKVLGGAVSSGIALKDASDDPHNGDNSRQLESTADDLLSHHEDDESKKDLWSLPREFTAGRENKKFRECGKVFPDERLLDLHEIECHDPSAKRQQEDGFPIFQCFLPPSECGRKFGTTKKRRLHLIYKHNYPHQYFFSITNHGLNKITAEEGLGASLIRPVKTRESAPGINSLKNHQEDDLEFEDIGHQIGPKISHSSNHDASKAHDRNPTQVDIDMDDIIGKLESSTIESSLVFKPRQVRGKNKNLRQTVSPSINA